MSFSRHAMNLVFVRVTQHNSVLHKFILSGHVYGERALEAQALQNEGQVICPRTKEIYSFKDAEKVYIM